MKWNDYFKIIIVDSAGNEPGDDDWLWGDERQFQVRDPDNKLIGTYKDEKYAKKQAKYKFKKLTAKLEKILLS